TADRTEPGTESITRSILPPATRHATITSVGDEPTRSCRVAYCRLTFNTSRTAWVPLLLGFSRAHVQVQPSPARRARGPAQSWPSSGARSIPHAGRVGPPLRPA